MTEICKCGRTKENHIKEISRKNRKDVEILYCYSINELKDKKVNWDDFVSRKFRKK